MPDPTSRLGSLADTAPAVAPRMMSGQFPDEILDPVIREIATWLERNGHADAAGSVREGLEETLTVLKLGLPPTLRRFFATTNCIENLIGTLRHVTRNIKR
jgi:putative transposase